MTVAIVASGTSIYTMERRVALKTVWHYALDLGNSLGYSLRSMPCAIQILTANRLPRNDSGVP